MNWVGGGPQIEDTLVVTEDGAEYLVDYSRALFVADWLEFGVS